MLAGKVFSLSQSDSHLLYKIFEPTNDIEQVFTRKRKGAITAEIGNVQKKPKKYNGHEVSADYSANNCQSNEIESHKSSENILRNYFQLDVNLESLYEQWSKIDINFANVAPKFVGVRMLRQDPVENLFSFICSSNNNISRISGMVERMCVRYGRKLLVLDGQDYYTFPSINALAQPGVEVELRSLGFGYRAKYITETAKWIIKNRSIEWLYSLRDLPYEEAHAELVKLQGVGAKVLFLYLFSFDIQKYTFNYVK